MSGESILDKSTLDKSVMSAEQEALQAELFCSHFPDPFHNPRIDKARSLYRLGYAAQGGCILELGTYHGCGTIALAWGAEAAGRYVQVYTIDPYIKQSGWIGEPYVPEDKGIFLDNVAKAGVTGCVHLVQMGADEALPWWGEQKHAVSVLFWDIGGDRLLGDFIKWHVFVGEGGLFAVHDTSDRKFGFDTVSGIAQAAGVWKFEGQMPGYVYMLRRV